ncbi:unnamed protein product [Boreogadus saida]
MELPFPSSHTKPKRQIHFRNVKNINMDALALDLQHLSSGSTDSLSVADSVNLCNQSLSSLLDLHAPLTSSTMDSASFSTMDSASRPVYRRTPPRAGPIARLAGASHTSVENGANMKTSV